MAFPDRIERTVEVVHPPEKVWAADEAEAIAEQVFAALADPPGAPSWRRWPATGTASSAH